MGYQALAYLCMHLAEISIVTSVLIYNMMQWNKPSKAYNLYMMIIL